MKSKPYLTESELNQMLDASVAEERRNAWKVAIAIVAMTVVICCAYFDLIIVSPWV